MDSTPSPSSPVSLPYYESAEKPFDYKHYFFLIKKNITLLITFFVMGLTLATIHTARIPDFYTSTAQILLERPGRSGSPQMVGQAMMEPDIFFEDYYVTQENIILGDTVLRETADEMKLTEYFNVQDIDLAASRIRGSLSVRRIKGSRLFEILARGPDPQFVATLANSVARAYIRKNFENQLYYSKELLGWLPQGDQEMVTVEDPFGKVRQMTRDELIESLPTIRTDPSVRELRGKIAALESDLESMSNQYREKHPLVVKAKAKLDFLKESIASEKQRVLEQLKQQATGQYQVTHVRISEEAEVPRGPSGPNRSQMVIKKVGIEMIVILFLIFLWDYFDDTIHSPDDLGRRGISMAFLGPVPLIKKEEIPRQERSLIAHYQRNSPIAESFRYLRVAINFSAPPEALKNLLFTSSLEHEGKSFVAHNIAVSLAQDGNRTLVIDADLRKPVGHRIYGMENMTGLSNFLTSEIEFDSVVRQTFVENLSIIVAGPVSPNPAEILGSSRMKLLLEKAREKFDRIIIDTTPVTGIGDPLVLGSLTNHVVFVIHAAKTPSDVILKSKEILEKSGVRIIGCVLNSVDLEKERYGGYYKFYYQTYGGYYVSKRKMPDAPEEGKKPKRRSADPEE